MRNVTLSPEHILRAGGDGGIVKILEKYITKYKTGFFHDIPPVFVVVNEPAIIRDTLESRAREKQERIFLQTKSSPRDPLMPKFTVDELVYLSKFQPVTTIISISRDPNSTYMESKFSEVIMEAFDYVGSWDAFIKKYNAGYFYPLYIHPDVLRYEGETDIVEVCTKDNGRLTYSGEVLTRQQYEKKTKLLLEKQERDLTTKVEREFCRFSEVENLMRKYIDRGVEYLLVDGNHRALAAALSGNPVNCLVLTSDSDVQESICMAESGRIKDFHQRWQTLKELKISLYDFYAGNIDSVSTVQELASQIKS